MGFFDKIKGIVKDAKEQIAGQVAQRQEEEKRRQEEEKRRQEEATRFNPVGKNLEWFGSEDGLKAYGDYIKAQNYLLEETVKKEHEEKHSDVSFEIFASVYHKDAKLPRTYFRSLVDKIESQVLEYVGPTEMLVAVLLIQAKPFYINDDGEPQSTDPNLKPEEIVSVEKNPTLHFAKNFDCFELGNDAQGSWEDKYNLWSKILTWLALFGRNMDIISENPWIFSKEVYFNEVGTVRKVKGFYKRCMELVTDEIQKAYFEEKYNECQ